MNRIRYAAGREIDNMNANFAGATLVLLAMAGAGCQDDQSTRVQGAVSPQTAAEIAKRKAQLTAACGSEAQTLQAGVPKAAPVMEKWAWINRVEECNTVVEMKALSAQADQLATTLLRIEINDRRESAPARRMAIEALVKRRPEEGQALQQLREQLDAQVERQAKQREREARRKEGVRIGMTAEDVLQSSWGKPSRVNRTTGANGESEQWVYPGQNYLYFERGRLVTIQN